MCDDVPSVQVVNFARLVLKFCFSLMLVWHAKHRRFVTKTWTELNRYLNQTVAWTRLIIINPWSFDIWWTVLTCFTQWASFITWYKSFFDRLISAIWPTLMNFSYRSCTNNFLARYPRKWAWIQIAAASSFDNSLGYIY